MPREWYWPTEWQSGQETTSGQGTNTEVPFDGSPEGERLLGGITKKPSDTRSPYGLRLPILLYTAN
jgi:hypothetical protein